MQVPPKPEDPRNQAVKPEVMPEMLGATSEPFYVQGNRTEISFEVHPPRGPAIVFPEKGPVVMRADGSGARIILKFESITARQPAPALDVFVNLPANEAPEKHPRLFAGRLPMFGLFESSTAGENHPGSGLHHSLDITAVYGYLGRLPGWNPKVIHVTIVPKQPTGARIRMGRVSLYIS